MAQFSSILPNFSGLILTSGRMRLRLLQVLGTGAYGVVYLAHDINSPTDAPMHYAVKCLLKQPENSEYRLLQKREIAYHQSASCHPHVVKLHDVIEEEYYLYLILDHCPGGDLFSAIIDRGLYRNNDEGVKKTFLQLVDAVHSCHDLGISHRDLKPENVLCSAENDRVYLADFGLATKARLSVTYGCGSSFYMSPECIGSPQCRRPFVTTVSDIWALGVILVNLITGRNPWHAAVPGEDSGFTTYLKEGEPYLRRMLPISRSASALLARIFVLNPEQRINLNQLRAAINDVDTFFPDPSDSELSMALTEPASAVGSVDITDQPHSSVAASHGSDDLELVAIRPLPSPFIIVLKDSSPAGVTALSRSPSPSRYSQSSTRANASHSSSSGSESHGPVTPQTHAVSSSSPVPEFHLELSQAPARCDHLELGLVESDVTGSTASLVMKKRKLPRSWERFVERISFRA